MTYQSDCTLPVGLLEQIAVIAAEGTEALTELIRILINEAMRLESEQHLGAGLYDLRLFPLMQIGKLEISYPADPSIVHA